MRISTSMLFQRGVDGMLERQVDLSKTERQMASGNRILQPSDDPSAATRVLDLDEQKTSVDQYQRNIDAARARLTQEETVIDSMVNVLQRVRELSVQGNSDTLNTADRQALASEVREHLDGLLQLANTRDANGEYIFAGNRTDTVPFTHDGVGGFTYAGDQGQRKVQIATSREVAIGDSGDAVFENIPRAAGGSTSMLRVVYDLATDLQAGNSSADALTDIDAAFGRLDDIRSQVGARLNALDNQQRANEGDILAIEQNRSTLADLDYAEAVSRFQQQLAALQASQQAFVNIQNLSLFNFLR